jgi:hypothetical protein
MGGVPADGVGEIDEPPSAVHSQSRFLCQFFRDKKQTKLFFELCTTIY